MGVKSILFVFVQFYSGISSSWPVMGKSPYLGPAVSLKQKCFSNSTTSWLNNLAWSVEKRFVSARKKLKTSRLPGSPSIYASCSYRHAQLNNSNVVRVSFLLKPFATKEWPALDFSKQHHCRIKRLRHYNKGTDHQLKKLLTV